MNSFLKYNNKKIFFSLLYFKMPRKTSKRSKRSYRKRHSTKRSKRRSSKRSKRRSTKRRSAFKLSKYSEKKINKIAKIPGMTKLQKLKEMDKLLDRAEKRHFK